MRKESEETNQTGKTKESENFEASADDVVLSHFDYNILTREAELYRLLVKAGDVQKTAQEKIDALNRRCETLRKEIAEIEKNAAIEPAVRG
jgi:hypothetical protein